ncbi:MAG: hypothetical protein LBR31_06800 [Desulfovibrio sp.]|nr:hypothetical protein [Desulfovibrio sp.]
MDFFDAFAPDIAPAAGPSGATGGNRYHDYGDAGLTDGLNHLDGLDYASPTTGVSDTFIAENAAFAPATAAQSDAATAAAPPTGGTGGGTTPGGVSVTPSPDTPPTVTPPPSLPEGFRPAFEVDESALAAGTKTPDGFTDRASYPLPDGWTVDQASLDALNGSVAGKGEFSVENGQLVFTLTGNVAHDDAGQTDETASLSDMLGGLNVTLTHTESGHSESVGLGVTVHDDAPVGTLTVTDGANNVDITGAALAPVSVGALNDSGVNYGADDKGGFQVSFDGGKTYVPLDQNGEAVNPATGDRVSVDAAGEVSFTPGVGTRGDVVLDFRAVDGDGDPIAGSESIDFSVGGNYLYDARAVLYTQGAQAGESVVMKHVGEGSLVMQDGEWIGGTPDMGKYLTATTNPDGTLSFVLNVPVGSLPGDLEGYYKVTGSDGQTHVVQVVVPKNSNYFDSAESPADVANVPDFHSKYGNDDWYRDNRVQGETHAGSGYNEAYGVDSSDMGDDVTFTGRNVDAAAGSASRTQGVQVTTGEGSDTVTVNGDVYLGANRNVVLNLGGAGNDDNDRLTINGGVFSGSQSDNNDILISTGTGTDTIDITGSVAAGRGGGKYVGNTSDIVIDAGTGGEKTIDIGGDVKAYRYYDRNSTDQYGNVRIQTGEADDTLHIGGNISVDAVQAQPNPGAWRSGTVSIETGAGEDTVIVDGTVSGGTVINTGKADRDGDAVDGADTVTINGGAGGYSLSGSTIITGAGEDKVSLAGGATSSSILAGEGSTTAAASTTDTAVKTVDVGGTVYISTVVTAAGDDVLTVGGNVQNSTVRTGEGSDTLDITGDVHANWINSSTSTVLDLGGSGPNDNDELHIGGSVEASGNSNQSLLISTGQGKDTIDIKGNVTANTGDYYYATNSVSIDAGGGGGKTIAIGGDVTAKDGYKSGQRSYAAVDISSGEGNDVVTIGGDFAHDGVGGLGSGHAVLATGAGEDTVNIDGVARNVVINTGKAATDATTVADGTDTVTISGGTNGYSLSGSTIITGAGEDVVSLAGGATGSSILAGEGSTAAAASTTDTAVKTVDIGGNAYTSTVVTAAGNDSITVDKSVYDSTVHMGEGSDKLDIAGDVHANWIGNSTSTVLDLGDGDDTLLVGGSLEASGNSNQSLLITGGQGTDTIDIKGDVTAYTGDYYYARNSVNIDAGGGGDKTVTIGGDIKATDGYKSGQRSYAAVDISSGEGNDVVTIGGSLVHAGVGGLGAGHVSVATGAGADTVNIGGSASGVVINTGKSATDPADAKDGADTVNIGGTFGGSIITGEGSDAVNIGGKVAGSTINTAGAIGADQPDDDVVNIGGGLSYSHIITGEGSDTVNINGDVTVYSQSGSTIDLGGSGLNDNDKLNISGSVTAGGIGSDNDITISTGAGEDSIHIGGGVTANTGGSSNVADVVIDAGDGGEKTIVIDGDVKAYGYRDLHGESAGRVTITTGEGEHNDTVLIGGDLSVSATSVVLGERLASVSVSTGAGDDRIAVGGSLGRATIDGGDGIDALNLGYDAGAINLSSLLAGNTIKGIEILDLRDATSANVGEARANVLTFNLDALPNGDDSLGGDLRGYFAGAAAAFQAMLDDHAGLNTGLIIRADANDTVNVDPTKGWGSPESVHLDGADYHLYTKGDQYLLVEVHDTAPLATAGDDILLASASAGSIDALDGNDIVYGDSGNNTIFGGDGDDRLFGRGGDDFLDGGDGNDVLYGGDGNDYLDGGAGSNEIHGGAGNDLIVYHPTDTISGGDGIDALLVDGTGSLDSLLSNMNNLLDDHKDMEIAVGGVDVSKVNDLTQIGITVDGDGVKVDMGADGWEYKGSTDKDGHEHAEFVGKGENGGMVVVVEADSLSQDTQNAINALNASTDGGG